MLYLRLCNRAESVESVVDVLPKYTYTYLSAFFFLFIGLLRPLYRYGLVCVGKYYSATQCILFIFILAIYCKLVSFLGLVLCLLLLSVN